MLDKLLRSPGIVGIGSDLAFLNFVEEKMLWRRIRSFFFVYNILLSSHSILRGFAESCSPLFSCRPR